MFPLLLALIIFGVFLGIFFGLIPGLHPNFLVVFIPVFSTLGAIETVVFVVSIAISNALTDIIPSVFLSAPEVGSELSALPGNRMLMKGNGYDAVKIYVIAAYFSIIFCIALLPLFAFFIPFAYSVLNSYIWLLLMFFVFYMILTENKKIVTLVVILLCSLIGILLNHIPENNVILLFPVFSGFFGASIFLLQIRSKPSFPEQSSGQVKIKRSSFVSSVFGGSSAGVLAGFLPGVGSSQIGTLITTQKKDENFIATMGALTASNIFLSVLCLWFIDRSRSGVAVVLQNVLPTIGLKEVLFMSTAALISVSLSIIFVIIIAKKFSVLIKNINYSFLSKLVLSFIVIIIALTAGVVGIFLFVLCLSIGIYSNLSGIKRSNMMCILIVPTILFFFPF